MKISILTAFITLFVLSSCATTLKTEDHVAGRLIYRNINLQPGTVVWSPDSARIAAIINKTLSIYDTKSGMSRSIAGVYPVFIEWAPGNNLLIVHEVDGRKVLASIDADDEKIKLIPLQEEPDAVKWLRPPDELIVLSTEVKTMIIGTFIIYKLIAIEDENPEIVFNEEIYFPTRRQTFEYMTGWTFAGIRPVYGTFLVPEYHNPPRLSPYTLFKTVDPLVKEIKELYKLKDPQFNSPSSWSPDGSHLAITNSNGSLKIIDIKHPDKRLYTDDIVKGRFPSWNPAGSQIYIGGWIVQSDGSPVEQLIPDAHESMGIWSPDGTGLAILFKNNCYYLDGFSPKFQGDDRPMDAALINIRDNIRTLKKRFKEGLINENEFNITRNKLLTQEVTGK